MSFILSGDTHGMIDIDKIPHFFYEHKGEYTEKDYLIICGDVGVCGFNDAEEAEVRATLRKLPVTTLFIDGNHENFRKLNSYKVDTWNGGKVHIIEDKIIHLMRGQVFEIGGKRFFTFGGAYSIDKMYRREGISWFPEEMPTAEEYEEGRKNLEECGNKVDYILTHTAPQDVTYLLGYGKGIDEESFMRRYLQQVSYNTNFIAWFFGHFHTDRVIGKFACLYNDLGIIP